MNRKTIFTTGAAQGIGLATAILFAEKGWFVGLTDVNENLLKTAENLIGAENCLIAKVDVRNKEEIVNALKVFGEKTGEKMDVLFNNAGILIPGGFENVRLEQHQSVIDINLIGLMNMTQKALPMLKNTPESYIINMCSASALYGNPEIVAYAATKSAVKSLTEAWNMLFKKFDIHVCDLLPTYVATKMVTDNLEKLDLTPQKIKMTPEFIAQKVWQAANSNRMHHYVGLDTQALRFLKWLLPEALFSSILRHTFYKKSIQ